jgi:hypothetical protein
LRDPEPLREERNVGAGRSSSCGQLLLKRVKDIDDLTKAYRVDRPVRVPRVVRNDLDTPGPWPFQGLALGCLPPNCARPSALPSSSFAGSGKAKKSRFAEPTQSSGLSPIAKYGRIASIPDLG